MYRPRPHIGPMPVVLDDGTEAFIFSRTSNRVTGTIKPDGTGIMHNLPGSKTNDLVPDVGRAAAPPASNAEFPMVPLPDGIHIWVKPKSIMPDGIAEFKKFWNVGRDSAPPASKTENPTAVLRTLPSYSSFGNADSVIGRCSICLEDGKHFSAACPYFKSVPKGARVGSCCEIICVHCGSLLLGGCCGEQDGRAILKYCFQCGSSEHWSHMCPKEVRVDKTEQAPLSVDLAPADQGAPVTSVANDGARLNPTIASFDGVSRQLVALERSIQTSLDEIRNLVAILHVDRASGPDRGAPSTSMANDGGRVKPTFTKFDDLCGQLIAMKSCIQTSLDEIWQLVATSVPTEELKPDLIGRASVPGKECGTKRVRTPLLS